MKELQIEWLSIDQINAAPYNPRKKLKPSDPQYQKLKQSIEYFGYVDPLIWNKRTGHLVGGHQRFQILKDKGLNQVQVSVVDIDLEQEKSLNLALNKIKGTWDEELLKDVLQEISSIDDELALLAGFDDTEINQILHELDDHAEKEAKALFHSEENRDEPNYSETVNEQIDEEELSEVPEAIELNRISSDIKRTLNRNLSFGKVKVPISQEEYELLLNAYELHVETKKTPFGFVFSLIGSD
jgi:ParB-like chromosome segregation protein Spo0J